MKTRALRARVFSFMTNATLGELLRPRLLRMRGRVLGDVKFFTDAS
jgi:hypothetical protein